MVSASVRIPVAGFTLVGEARLNAGAPGAVVCHPHPAFGGRMDTPLVVALAEALAEAGLSTVRFNFRGLDGSEGEATGGHEEHADVTAVAAWLLRQGAPRVALVGYSFGALMAARALTDGKPARQTSTARARETSADRARQTSADRNGHVFAFAAVALPTTIVGHDPARVAPLEAAVSVGVPSLFVSGDRDQFCETERIAGWIAGKPWARQELLPGRGHFFAGADAQDVCTRVVEFVRRAQGAT